nr:MAG TPA: hypothetical protein [Bacteriophage sp.]DAV37437.1 MAG TPA: hypothetical protein [Caudoviricetes sp.]
MRQSSLGCPVVTELIYPSHLDHHFYLDYKWSE